jgi:hypothetical protein
VDLEAGKKRAWHFIRLGIGWLLAAIGIVLLVLPGPGFLFLIPGLTLLSAESRWVRRLLRRARERWYIRRALREAEKVGIKLDLGPDDEDPDEPSASGPPRPAT